MEFTILKDKLVKTLSKLNVLASGNNTKLILNNVKLDLKENELTLTGGDGSTYSSIKLEVEQSFSNGTLLVNCSKLLSIARNMQEIITLTECENVVNIICGNSKYEINKTDDEYPSFDELSKDIELKNKVEIDSESLSDWIKRTLPFVSPDMTRPALSGIYFGNNALASTDGMKLVEQKIIDTSFDFVLPASSAKVVMDIASETKSNCEIYTDNTVVIFKFKDSVIYTRTISGKFPQYQSLIPVSFDNSIMLNRQDFVDSMGRLLSATSSELVDIDINMENQFCISISKDGRMFNNDIVKAEDFISYESFSVYFSVKINAKMMLNLAKVMKSEKIKFAWNSNVKPLGIFECENPSYKAILMPIKIMR